MTIAIITLSALVFALAAGLRERRLQLLAIEKATEKLERAGEELVARREQGVAYAQLFGGITHTFTPYEPNTADFTARPPYGTLVRLGADDELAPRRRRRASSE